MTYIDVHGHIHFPQFDGDREQVLARMRAASVAAITVGCDARTSKAAVELANKSPDIWATVGIHPSDNRKEEFDTPIYRSMAEEPRVVAIGECGLDFYRTPAELREKEEARQTDLFKHHIELALSVEKPLMIHSRPSRGAMDAYEKIIDILSSYKKAHPQLRGNVHFFVGDERIARQFVEWDFTLSFTGVITFARDYDEMIRAIPLGNVLSETDCPYVAPAPYRGQRNESSYVVEVVKKIAELKNLSVEETGNAIAANAEKIFGPR